MQKLNLTKRPAKIGKSVNTRTEMHGKDEVPGQDIPLSGILLSVDELCAITDEVTAGTGLFKMEGDQYVPRFLAFGPVPVAHKFENATVKMSGGVPVTTYKNGKIKSIYLTPVGGGMTEMSCTLQVNPDNGDPSAQMLINAKVSITLKAELEQDPDEDQPDLPLDHQDSVGDPVPMHGLMPEDSAEDPMSRMGRKIQRRRRDGARSDSGVDEPEPHAGESARVGRDQASDAASDGRQVH